MCARGDDVGRAVHKLGDKFGHVDAMKGKKVVIEHTSANPNAPLHIGNLRNVMIGAHLANVMNAVPAPSLPLPRALPLPKSRLAGVGYELHICGSEKAVFNARLAHNQLAVELHWGCHVC